jgi:CRISPR-associated protein Cas2
MKGCGEWVQLSVFQCRLTPKQQAELVYFLDGIIHHSEDHIVVMDLGFADHVSPRVVSLGKAELQAIEHEPVASSFADRREHSRG